MTGKLPSNEILLMEALCESMVLFLYPNFAVAGVKTLTSGDATPVPKESIEENRRKRETRIFAEFQGR